jgi:hypothetical protein
VNELSVDRSSSLYLGLAVAAAVGFFAYYLLASEKNWSTGGAAVIVVAGIFMAVMFVWTETRPRPALHIGPNGIRDNVSGLGFIPWEDIESIELLRLKYPAIGLKFREASKIGVSDGTFSKARRTLLFKGCTPIDLGMLKANSDEVMTVAHHFFEASKAPKA